jgi:oxygen-independent coproporphyrinogen-3 oxidase
MIPSPLGLYIHVPFCSRICHYCDFAKSANFNEDHVQKYFAILSRQVKMIIERLPPEQKFTSVYFGGGTPGLFTKEYEFLLSTILSSTIPNAEVTIEVNPLNVTKENTKIWRALGFNRISLGLQSFQDEGLKSLTREHSREQGLTAVRIAAEDFSLVNGDLIYGWSGQTKEAWQKDLKDMVESGCGHISAYALTYEGNTPFARAERRGVMTACADDDLYEFYRMAQSFLGAYGYQQEEVSNWAKIGHEAAHNWLYWRGLRYVGLGCGAHGFVDDGSKIGLRYSFDGDFRKYLKWQEGDLKGCSSLQQALASAGAILDTERTLESWMLEYVGSSLRCRDGIDLNLLQKQGFEFKPSPIVYEGLKRGDLVLKENQVLILKDTEWFRETSWAGSVCDSLNQHR